MSAMNSTILYTTKNMESLDLDFMSSVLNAFDHVGVDALHVSVPTTSKNTLLSPENSAQDLFTSVQEVHAHHAIESVATREVIKPALSDAKPALTDAKPTLVATKPVLVDAKPLLVASKPVLADVQKATLPEVRRSTLKVEEKPDELAMALQALKNMPLSPARRTTPSSTLEAEQRLAAIKQQKPIETPSVQTVSKGPEPEMTITVPERLETVPEEGPKVEQTPLQKEEEEVNDTRSKARAMYLNRKKVTKSASQLSSLAAIAEQSNDAPSVSRLGAAETAPKEEATVANTCVASILLDMSMLGISEAEKHSALAQPAIKRPVTARPATTLPPVTELEDASESAPLDVSQKRSGTLKRRLSRLFGSNGIQRTFKEVDDPFASHSAPDGRQRRDSAAPVTRRKSFFATLKRNKTVNFGATVTPQYTETVSDSRYNTIRGEKPKGARLPADATLRSSFESLDHSSLRSSSSSLHLSRPALPPQPPSHTSPFATSLNKSKTLSLKKDPHYDGTMTIRRSKEWAEKLAALKQADSGLYQWRDHHPIAQ